MSLMVKLREELQELQKKKKVTTIKIQGYLKILTELLDIGLSDHYPGLLDEIKEIWRKLDDLMGDIYQKDSLLGLLWRESELRYNMLIEEKHGGKEEAAK